MNRKEVCSWVSASPARVAALLTFDQPLTGMQLARRLRIMPDSALSLLSSLRRRGLVRCLTPQAQVNRVHWLTDEGALCQAHLLAKHGFGELMHRFPELDWDLYAKVCFNHRAAVIKVMNGWMRPPQIRWKALAQTPSLRMSRSNCRDVLRQLLEMGVARSGRAGKISFPHYALTNVGVTVRDLLRGAEHRI